MRGKCATCEFFKLIIGLERGTCHIRSVASDRWPERPREDGCGEHMPQSIQRDPPGPLDDLNVHEGERVEKSMFKPCFPRTERIEEPS